MQLASEEGAAASKTIRSLRRSLAGAAINAKRTAVRFLLWCSSPLCRGPKRDFTDRRNHLVVRILRARALCGGRHDLRRRIAVVAAFEFFAAARHLRNLAARRDDTARAIPAVSTLARPAVVRSIYFVVATTVPSA